tara:strand:- start:385 stop:1050 length:666 start_codon:yes stop_codon:yes gene_type:complete
MTDSHINNQDEGERQIVPLFPTPLFITKFLNDETCEKYAQKILGEELEETNAERNFTQTVNKRLHVAEDPDPEWEVMAKNILLEVEGCFDYLCVKRDAVYLSNLWANIGRHTEGYFHFPHTHPNSFLSGIIYIQGDTSAGTRFIDPRPAKKVICPDCHDSSIFTTGIYEQEFQKGNIMIFPSWLEHSVINYGGQNNKERISLSFNAMFHGEIDVPTQYLKL